jgi:hypothetical protein
MTDENDPMLNGLDTCKYIEYHRATDRFHTGVS